MSLFTFSCCRDLLRQGPTQAAALLCSLALCLPLLSGVEVGEMTYEQELASLRAMVGEHRDTEVYELDFEPLVFDRILVRDRMGDNQVFHYLTFRLRNRVSDNAEYLAQHANVYNEILDQMVREYGFLRKTTEGGASLVLDDVRALEDERMAVILERQDLRVRTRRINLTAVAFDDKGTRFRLFDPVPGEGPQEDFNFEDRGLDVGVSNFYRRVHEAIEEQHRQRLYTVHEIRGLEIPPYDAHRPSTFDDGYGMAQGEIFGVVIFDRLSVLSNAFTLHFQGLSNKQRFHWPERLPPGKVEDYFNLRVSRRTFVMEFTRPGDEFYRDRNHFTQRASGWRWVERFVRLEQRRAIAYARYFRSNIRLARETTRQGTYPTVTDQGQATEGTTAVPVLHDERIARETWAHYNDVRQRWPDRFQQRIDQHRIHGEEVLSLYQPRDEQKSTSEERQRISDEHGAWQAVIDQHIRILEGRRNALNETLPDWQATTRERR